MKRFAVLLLALAMTVCCALPAFAAGTIEVTEDVSVSDDYDWTRFKGQNVAINVYNWGEYISNGSDDSVDVVDAFQQLTGIHVNYTTFDSNESLYAKLKSGAADYDVIIPSDYMVAKMISEGMLAKLNFDNIPNFQNIDEVYRNADYDPANEYTVPYMLCTTGIIYNTTMVDKAPASWADLWDEQYAGNILMFNNSRDAYAIAAFKSGNTLFQNILCGICKSAVDVARVSKTKTGCRVGGILEHIGSGLINRNGSCIGRRIGLFLSYMKL